MSLDIGDGKESAMDVREEYSKIADAVEMIRCCFSDGGKLLVCGNGGSAATARIL